MQEKLENVFFFSLFLGKILSPLEDITIHKNCDDTICCSHQYFRKKDEIKQDRTTSVTLIKEDRAIL